MKPISAKPEAELAPRPGDEILSSDELQLFDLFASLTKKVSVEKFPGSLVLRHYRQGEIICRQGDRGHSAFYIASAADIERLQARRAARESEAPKAEPSHPAQVATAHLFSAAQPTVKSPGVLNHFSSRRNPQLDPAFIPNDGPADIDYHTRQAPMFEGDVFGEMSCMTFAPRSATVVADADCYMVEFQRNIFDQMQKDAGYRQRVDDLYEQRVLTNHLRRLQIFRNLDDESLKMLRDAAKLEVVDPGTVICNEGDPSDCVYIIRSGVVQVVHGAHVALQIEDLADWPGFCKLLLAGGTTRRSDAAFEATPRTSPADQPPKAAASPQDILAAARAAAGKTKQPPAKPAKPPRTTAEMLAMARAQKKGNTTEVESAGKPRRLIVDSPPKETDSPEHAVWRWLDVRVQEAVRRLSQQDASQEGDKSLVVAALNGLIRDRRFIASKDLRPTLHHPDVSDFVRTLPGGAAGADKEWAELEVRMAAALALRSLYRDSFTGKGAPTGPLHSLDYMARGDCFGEMGVVMNQLRQASCIAYDHPMDDPSRKSGRVELVRIEAAAFRSLLDSSAEVRSSVERMISQRRSNLTQSEQRPPWSSGALLSRTKEFRDLGLIQGQKLLLIDLDRCTRCGDCVRACVNTHHDGYSRLFLDGPRFDRFLVPSACRQCLNPACMIGCPVGSIQRGEQGQIEIRDWCIGCGLCARQCPYDSIQMHDVGIIPESSIGWQFAPASTVSSKHWTSRAHRHRGWQLGAAPFRWTLDWFRLLAARGQASGWRTEVGMLPEPLCFRYHFSLTRDQRKHAQFRLLLTSEGCRAEMWLNGHKVELRQDARQQKKGEFEARLDNSKLRRKSNLLSVQVSPPEESDEPFVPAYDQTMLAVRLDPIPDVSSLASRIAGDAQLEMELVTERAVVCDLCSSLPSREPACVSQCPHDAAIRFDARRDFPRM